jgi:choloylglycine hydrolase
MKSLLTKTLLSLGVILILASLETSSQPVTGIDSLSTINSFQAVGEFYSMDYTGDYNTLLDWMDDLLTGSGSRSFEDFKCSLFSANGDLQNQFLGRNFDNPQNDVLICRYDPPDGYSSLAFSRMNDLGYAYGTNYNNLTFQQMLPLLQAAYFVPDGINEHGLAAGLASVDPVSYGVDPSKDTIFVTRLVREILDHASTIDEAVEIANNYNVFDNGVGIISHHLLVGSVLGESVTLEFHDGAFQVIESEDAWQVLTNIPVYNIPHEQLMNSCWRYQSLYSTLEENSGILNWSQGMEALEEVHINCPWSAIYDLNNRGIYISVHNNFEDISFTEIENFGFIVYVGIIESSVVGRQSSVTVYPNPTWGSSQFAVRSSRSEYVTIKLYDMQGREVATVANGMMPEGEHRVHFDASGIPAGVYVYRTTEVRSQKSGTGKLVIMK